MADIATRVSSFIALVHVAGLIHFGPSLLAFYENYAAGSFKIQQWSGLVTLIAPIYQALVAQLLGVSGVVGACLGIAGFYPRCGALLAGLGWYGLASVNSLHTQTLALTTFWSLLWLIAIVGPSRAAPGSSWLFARFASWSVLGTVALSAVHKLSAGWPSGVALATIMQYPEGSMLRQCVSGELSRPQASLLEAATLGVELVTPALLILGRFTRLATIIYVGFFMAITASIQVPLLFPLLFVGVSILFPAASLRPQPSRSSG